MSRGLGKVEREILAEVEGWRTKMLHIGMLALTKDNPASYRRAARKLHDAGLVKVWHVGRRKEMVVSLPQYGPDDFTDEDWDDIAAAIGYLGLARKLERAERVHNSVGAMARNT